MNDAKATQEPSMEEILASIRRIISEEGSGDEPKAAEPTPAPKPAAPPPVQEAAPPPPPPPVEDEDLVLTDEVIEDVPAPAPEPEPEPELEPEPAPEPEPAIEEEIELAPPPPPPPPPRPTPAPQMAEPAEQVSGHGSGQNFNEPPLVSPDVADASASAMAQLIARRAQTVVEVQSPGQGLLVETLVRQAVEPMLRDWLDANLQTIVERLVRREVERIARRAELS
jgi:uncharacterized protein